MSAYRRVIIACNAPRCQLSILTHCDHVADGRSVARAAGWTSEWRRTNGAQTHGGNRLLDFCPEHST